MPEILCIHGYRQNGEVFKEKTGAFRKFAKKYAELVFVNAPFEIPDPGNESGMQRGWWFTRPGHFKAVENSDESIGLEKSVELIKTKLQEDGPFDGLLGFSQGAALAAIICSLKAQGEIPNSFWFAILVASFKSRCSEHERLYAPTIFMPSLHVYGDNDEIIDKGMSEELIYHFDQPSVLVHSGGHYVPASAQYRQTYNDFLERMLQIKLQNV